MGGEGLRRRGKDGGEGIKGGEEEVKGLRLGLVKRRRKREMKNDGLRMGKVGQRKCVGMDTKSGT